MEYTGQHGLAFSELSRTPWVLQILLGMHVYEVIKPQWKKAGVWN